MTRLILCISVLFLLCGCSKIKIFQGGNTGACCYSDGTCAEVAKSECTGSFQGYGTTCTPNSCHQPLIAYACCHFDGTCTEEFQTNYDGTFFSWCGMRSYRIARKRRACPADEAR